MAATMGWTTLIRRKLVDLPRGVLLPVWALGLLSIVVLWSAILYDVYADRTEALHQAETQTQSVALALREHVHGVISSADLILQRVDDSLARSSGVYGLPDWVALTKFLRETVIQVGIIGPDGYALAATIPDLGRIDLSDRDHFRVHLDPRAPQPYISRPVIGRGSGKPSIQISRRIEYPDGGFAGVGVVSLDPAYFNRFFESIDLGPNSLVYLIGRDGVLRARTTRAGPTIEIGQDFSGTPVMNTLLSAPQGIYRARSGVDGIERIYAFAADTDYPVIVAAATTVGDILGPHRLSEIVEFAAAAALSAVVLWLVYRSTQELSQRVQHERRLRQSQKLEAIGQLTAGVAHDFSNILTAIKGNVELAGRSSALDHGLRRILGNVEEAAQQGERIVSNLLAASRRQRLRPQPVDVNAIVRTAAELLRAGLGSRWTVRCELAPDLPPVVADESQVGTALLNLAINARDAMPAGGTVTFETRLVEVGEANELHDLAAGRYVAINTKDDGIGMSADIAARAFEPFFTTKEQGTGLGLSQVYGLAKQLGGTVTIDTAQHVGTTVAIYLPVAATQRASRKVAADVREPTDSDAATVLVADDIAQVRELICATLADAGHKVIEAYDGPSALDALGRHPFQLAILDVCMPGLSGIDVYERARERGWNGAVLFVSGFADPAHLARIRGKPFLAKPFGVEALRDQVARILAGANKATRTAHP
jgi:signal transduction histidine kinase/ActR/RegA family two-component response regulator